MPQDTVTRITKEEAIQRLKLEIIAQDWSLSINRISLLEEAFLFLKQHFADRKAARNILIMADNLLRFIKYKGGDIPSESIDFLKEAMAHIVNIYESEDLEPEKEEHLFKITYYRFNKLKEKIKSNKSSISTASPSDHPEPYPEKKPLEIKREEDPFNPEKIERIKNKIHSLQNTLEPAGENENPPHDIEGLINGLQMSLEKAESLTNKIREAVVDLQALESSRNAHREEEDPDPVKSCPPTKLREVIVEGQPVYLQESAIARISRLPSSKLGGIVQKKSIPVVSLAAPFRQLPKQFKGVLGSLGSEELKKLSLPVIVPQCDELPDHPDARAKKAITVSKGNLAGVLLCSETAKKTRDMVKFRKVDESETIFTGYSELGDPLKVLNVSSVLEQEGLQVF